MRMQWIENGLVCQKCGKALVFTNTDKGNGLIGTWSCANLVCKPLPIIKPADLILVRGSGAISGIIEGVTHSPYSHVAIVVKENELIEAQGFRPVGYQALDFYSGCADVYTCDELTDDDRVAIARYAEGFEGRHYSYLLDIYELLRYTLGVTLMPGKDWQPINCSTLAAAIYRKRGYDLWRSIRLPVPGDIPRTPRLRKSGSI